MRAAVNFTLTQATWSPDTYLHQKARLACLATGRARAEFAVPAGVTPADVVAQLRAAGSSSRATLLGSDGPDAAHRVVVAYKAVATGSGRTGAGADYQVAHVTLVRRHGRWLVFGVRDPAVSTGPPPVLPVRFSSTSASTILRAATEHPAAGVAFIIVAATVVGVIASTLVPELGPARAPRPTLRGTPGEALAIALANGGRSLRRCCCVPGAGTPEA